LENRLNREAISPMYGEVDRLVKAISTGYVQMIAAQCKMARAALGLSVADAAKAAGVSTNTIVRFEHGERLQERTIAAIQRALEAAGVEFLNHEQPGVRMRKGAPLKLEGLSKN
jgi:transcriptional regulator with XRE-family HTH domain